jgi:hypothetical protein
MMRSIIKESAPRYDAKFEIAKENFEWELFINLSKIVKVDIVGLPLSIRLIFDKYLTFPIDYLEKETLDKISKEIF